MGFEYWYMLPISILIATAAMASGVGGATFFTPLFVLVLGLPVPVAVAAGLMTATFGFASGLYAYSRKRLIDYRLGLLLLAVAAPMALAGTWVSGHVDPGILKVVLALILFSIAASFLRSSAHTKTASSDAAYTDADRPENTGGKPDHTCLTTADGETICYRVPNRTEGRGIACIGGLFLGLSSAGLGELNGYFLMQRSGMPSKVAIPTIVFVVAITSLSASVGHAVQLMQGGLGSQTLLLNLLVFTVPGVIIGGQLGPILARNLPHRVMLRALAILFTIVGVTMLAGV